MTVLCSTGTMFPPGSPYPRGPDDVPIMDATTTAVGADGLELLVTRGIADHLEAVAAALASTGIRVPAVHARKSLGAALPAPGAIAHLEETIALAGTIGASVIVLHLWNLPESDADMPARLEAIRVACDVAAGHDVVLAVETVPCLHHSPLRNIEAVLEHEPRAVVALDTEFLAHHGELDQVLDADALWTAGAVRHVHVKDYADDLVDGTGRRRYLSPGEGRIDFAALFAAFADRGYAGALSLEAPATDAEGRPDIDRLRTSIDRIRTALPTNRRAP